MNSEKEICEECKKVFYNHKDYSLHSSPCCCGNLFDCNPNVKLCEICDCGVCNIDCEEWHNFRFHFIKKCKICNQEHFTKDHV